MPTTILRGDPTLPLIVTVVERLAAAMPRTELWSCRSHTTTASTLRGPFERCAPESADHRCAAAQGGPWLTVPRLTSLLSICAAGDDDDVHASQDVVPGNEMDGPRSSDTADDYGNLGARRRRRRWCSTLIGAGGLCKLLRPNADPWVLGHERLLI